MVEHSPKILVSKKKATTTTINWTESEVWPLQFISEYLKRHFNFGTYSFWHHVVEPLVSMEVTTL